MNVDWSGVARRSVPNRPRKRRSTATDDRTVTPVLRGRVGGACYGIIALWLLTWQPFLAIVVFVLAGRRLIITERERRTAQPEPRPLAGVEARGMAELERYERSLRGFGPTHVQATIRGVEHPTVVIARHPGGEISERQCVSMAAALAYIRRERKKCEDAGVPFEVVDEIS